MNLRDEILIESYVLDPSVLSEEELEKVAGLIQSDPGASHLFDFFQHFYESFSQHSPEIPEPVVAFVDSLFESAESFELVPYRLPEVDRVTGLPFPTVLAASTDNGNRFETLSTLGSKENQTLARIVLDKVLNEATFFILSEHSRNSAHVLITLRDSATNFVTNARGRATLKLESDVREDAIRTSRALVTPATESYSLRTDAIVNDSTTMLEGSIACLQVRRNDSTLQFEISHISNEDVIFSHLVVEWPGYQFILPIHDRRCVLSQDPLPEQIDIRIYGRV